MCVFQLLGTEGGGRQSGELTGDSEAEGTGAHCRHWWRPYQSRSHTGTHGGDQQKVAKTKTLNSTEVRTHMHKCVYVRMHTYTYTHTHTLHGSPIILVISKLCKVHM